MGKVSLNINGRSYGLGCEEGEEERLLRLGQKLDARVATMASQFGQIGDLRLLVMAGITLLDEMEDPNGLGESDADREITALQKDIETAKADHDRKEGEAIDSLLHAAKRIEKLAKRLSDTGSNTD